MTSSASSFSLSGFDIDTTLNPASESGLEGIFRARFSFFLNESVNYNLSGSFSGSSGIANSETVATLNLFQYAGAINPLIEIFDDSASASGDDFTFNHSLADSGVLNSGLYFFEFSTFLGGEPFGGNDGENLPLGVADGRGAFNLSLRSLSVPDGGSTTILLGLGLLFLAFLGARYGLPEREI